LSTRLTDALGGNYAYGCVEVNQMPTSKILAIAPLAGTLPGLTAKGRPDMNLGYPSGNNFICFLLINFIIPVNDDFSGAGVDHFAGGQPTCYSLNKGW
jgi:hypothetical protein